MERFSAAGVCDAETHAQMVLAGSTLYLAGQLALDAEGQAVGTTCEQQAHQIWQRIGRLLRAAGADYDDIFRIVTYLVDIDDQATALRVRQAYLGDHRPASTLVGVAALERPCHRIQVEITARQPARRNASSG